jgi:hypothetical protein
LNQILRRQTSRFHYGAKVPAEVYSVSAETMVNDGFSSSENV